MDVFISEFTTNVASIYTPIEGDVWQSNALHRTNQLFVIVDGFRPKYYHAHGP